MTLEEEGAYIRLLCYCWKHGSIPSDLQKIASLIGKGASTTLATNVVTMFQPDPNDNSRLVHDRLAEEKIKQDAWRQKSSEGGKKSAETRKKLKNSNEKGQPPFNHPSTTLSTK